MYVVCRACRCLPRALALACLTALRTSPPPRAPAQEYGSALKVVKIEADPNQECIKKYNVSRV